ncbi:hypothetical protein K501DRAFT_319689 [Backusella circina FSU 941]|nr:hypothetical protein K501DRAFT_319689 [Backusella circina FSU 941]
MALYYGIVFAILAVEVNLIYIFYLPIPTRWQKPIFRWLATSPTVAHAQYIMKIVFAFVFILFLDSLNTVRAFYDVVQSSEDPSVPTGNADFRSNVSQTAKKFYAQRNIILNTTKNLTLDYIRLEDEVIQLRGIVSDDPADKKASLEADTEPIVNTTTKLEPVQRPSNEGVDRTTDLKNKSELEKEIETIKQD